ncbi:uncharacterized protein SAPINGB_P000118 [Magnusiomyces paraingens]|uniref:Enoyl reductase (ER) domain-containing protein n=1 Tax=Magnusiomyces paraingens TaxID=2606893 RepID=A0A5E8AYA1_9ASCO|nr:uncharacterized protein SAPINGB_P000118 [Saprochaete ingens]VVT43728.1 unnamed protein product [Saprochaete ingens]
MKAVLIKNQKGPSSALYIGEASKPARSSSDDVLIHVHCFGLNRMDILQREGHYPVPPGASPILGVEFSGTVAEIPDNNTSNSWSVGDKVFGLVTGGSYAEYVVCNQATLFKFPENLSNFDFVKAAAIPEVWLTATQVVLHIGKLQPNSRFLFHAGASGVGLAALQIARGSANARTVYCTVGSNDKRDFLLSSVASSWASASQTCPHSTELVPINYREHDFADAIKQHDPTPLDLIVDPVGQLYFQRNLDLLGRDSTLVLMGLMSGGVVTQGPVDLSPILRKALRIEGTTLRARSIEYKTELRRVFEARVLPHIFTGEFNVFIEKEFKWENIIEAHNLMESNKTMGKIIVHVN